MKKLLSLICASCAVLTASSAFAQAQNFQGFGASLALNFVNTTSEVGWSKFGIRSKGSDTDVDYALQAQYNWALGNQFVLGLGASTTLGLLNAGTVTMRNASFPIRIRESYALFVEPGYAVSKDWLLYGKVAYVSAKIEATGGGGSTNFASGTGLGFGAQMLINKSWYGQAEWMVNQYDDRGSDTEIDKLKSNALSLGVGYKF